MIAEGTPHRAFVANILGRQFKEQSAKASSLMAPLFPTLTSVTYRAAMSAATKALKIEHIRFTLPPPTV